MRSLIRNTIFLINYTRWIGVKDSFQSEFLFKKIKGDFFTLDFDNQFDVLYYDAFGYHAQSEMWQDKALQKCHDLLRQGGFGLVIVPKDR